MQLTINGKVLGIAAAVIAVGGGIVGGVAIHKNHKAEMVRKEAALAYANRPILEQDCVMSGLGEGSCSFTNTGKTEGALCGRIEVYGPGTHTGSKFCSGMVAPMSTTKVDFNEPAVRKLCAPQNYGQSWTDVCNFSFVKDGLGGGDTAAA